MLPGLSKPCGAAELLTLTKRLSATKLDKNLLPPAQR